MVLTPERTSTAGTADIDAGPADSGVRPEEPSPNTGLPRTPPLGCTGVSIDTSWALDQT